MGVESYGGVNTKRLASPCTGDWRVVEIFRGEGLVGKAHLHEVEVMGLAPAFSTLCDLAK